MNILLAVVHIDAAEESRCREQIEGILGQVLETLRRTKIEQDLNQTIIALNREIAFAKELGDALGKGLEIVSDLIRNCDSSLLKNLWSKLKGIFR